MAKTTKTTETTETPQQETVSISIQDIVLSANIIDLATQRGAFKAAEASHVGACFDKLVEFIKSNTPEEAKKPVDTPIDNV